MELIDVHSVMFQCVCDCRLYLTSDSKVIVHLINLKGVAYLLSSDISSFFWDEDVLTSMVHYDIITLANRLGLQ